MLTLCGFAESNYYMKVKLVLLEKQVRFTEEEVHAGQADRRCSPLGKVPFLRTGQGPLCESSAIVEYLESRYPDPPLMPSDPFAAAKVRELCLFMELHLERLARKLYPQALFGERVSDRTRDQTARQLASHVAAFARMPRWDPFLAGDQFTLADCAAVAHLPLIRFTTQMVYGEDFLRYLPLDDYLEVLDQRPHVRRLEAERHAGGVRWFVHGQGR